MKILSLDIEGAVVTVADDGSEVTVNGVIRKQWPNMHGYPTVKIVERNEIVHRLVARAHIENPRMATDVNHIDGDKTNNNVSNLEWVSRSENLRHAMRTGLHASPPTPVIGWKPSGAGLILSSQAASRQYGIQQANVAACLAGRRATAGGYKWEYAN